ncbi:hypothetical protein [Actinophytocola sp.]|uniref:hypothetical protein n=1 Tax=Actinophytocola sp. TaxID=1872138 RepID=UPI002D756628|nr:hypothetical protein [Actinophytocola sp.]HYQ66671.1 hypothetical protein [Actinophytocola sp.]
MTVDPDSNGTELEDLDFDDDLLDEYGEDFEDLVESLGLPNRLPALWLPPVGELAAAARESVLLRRVGELAAWVGERRAVTEEGDLTEPDAAEAAERLGVTPAELLLCWETALAADLVVVSEDDTGDTGGGSADGNPDLWPTGDDEEDLGTWAVGFTQVLGSLVIDAEVADEDDLVFDSAGALVLPMFLAREPGVPVAELQEIAWSMETEDLADDAVWDTWVAAHGDPVTTLLTRLAEHGAAEVDGEIARLTPLGMLIMREELLDGGIDIPLLPPPAEMPATDLLTVVGGRGGEELDELARLWLSTRDPAAAATELLAAAVEASPSGRFYAASVLAKLPDVPWRTVLAEPALRPYARDALGEPREPADAAWLLLDALSASANAMGELDPEAVEVVSAETLPAGREQEILAEAWRVRHPMGYEVLALIGAHHPDKQVAKTARTAAHKAQSAT